MNKDLRMRALAKTLLYISSAVGIAEMLTSNGGTIVVMLAIACMVSFIIDLSTL